MEHFLCAELVCSTGLVFSYGGTSILVDVLNGAWGSFKVIPPEQRQAVIQGSPPYDRVIGLLYSHLHTDHYDQESNALFLKNHPGAAVFFPQPDTPDRGMLRMGPFTVEYGHLAHTPCDYPWVKHYVLWITAGGTSVYLTTDAELSPRKHLTFLNGRQADYGFWNAMYLSYSETRLLLRQTAEKSFIYHMPEPETDASGICRKAALNMARHGAELEHVEVLQQYPTKLHLPPLRG